MAKQKWEKIIELVIIGIVVYIGFVSIFYSWIDTAFGITVNIVVLSVVALVASFMVVYAIKIFDRQD
jgi:divalent metal cation (Fe/Co/Zn/Cd) transporter